VVLKSRGGDNYDAVRGIAAVLVFVGHIHQVLWTRLVGSDGLSSLVLGVLSSYAVYAFFVLSGFLITNSILANIRRGSGAFDYIDYAASRIARIYPPLMFSITVVFAISFVIGVFDLPGNVAYGLPTDLWVTRVRYVAPLEEIVPTLLMRNGMLQANGPLWSLFIEGKIYVIAMGVAMAAARNGWLVRIAGVALAFIALRFSFRDNQWFAFYASIWCLGSIAALLKFNILPRAKLPDWICATGAFSYSLYILHFPLLLLALSLTQTWIDTSLFRAALVSSAAFALIIPFCLLTAQLFEDHKLFKRLLLRYRSAKELTAPAAE